MDRHSQFQTVNFRSAATRGAADSERPSEDDWVRLQGLIESIFQKLNARYFMCATAERRRNDGEVDEAFEEFHFRAQLYWCNVTGRQYQNLLIPASI